MCAQEPAAAIKQQTDRGLATMSEARDWTMRVPLAIVAWQGSEQDARYLEALVECTYACVPATANALRPSTLWLEHDETQLDRCTLRVGVADLRYEIACISSAASPRTCPLVVQLMFHFWSGAFCDRRPSLRAGQAAFRAG